MKVKNIGSKWIKRAGILALAGCVVFAGVTYLNKDEVAAATLSVEEYTIEKESISSVLSTSGSVVSETTAQLLGDVESEVTAIYVEIGDKVEAGQVLAEMNPIDVESEILDQQRVIANLNRQLVALTADKGTTTRLSYESSKVALDNAKQSYESNQVLFENGAISQSDLEQSEESYNSAVIAYESAKSTYDSYDYSAEYSILEMELQVENIKLESLQQDLENLQIIAPINGVVTAIDIEVGEVPKEEEVMIELQDMDNLKIEASISEYEIGDISVGQEVSISTLGNDDVTYTGTVEKIYPSGVISGSEVYVTIIIDVTDEDAYLKPNFSVNLDILVESREDALLVPYDALVSTPSGYAVKVKGDNDEAQFVRVETGIEGDLKIEVLSEHLEEGMTLLVETELTASADEEDGGLMIPGMGGGLDGGGAPPEGGAPPSGGAPGQ